MNRIISIKAIVFLILLSALMLCFCPVSVKAEGSVEIILDSVKIENTGNFEVIGHVVDAPLDTQVTFIMCPTEYWDSNGKLISTSPAELEIIHIDQVGTGNNGTFLIQGRVNEKWLGTEARFGGASSLGGYYTDVLDIPTAGPGLEIVANNSVLYGKDIYYINGGYYSPDNIAASIAYGGTDIYFKLADKWYNLMDKAAKDNSFLVSENASAITKVEKLKPRYYYSTSERIDFNWAA